MTKILFAIVALCFAQAIVCRVVRETAEATTEDPWAKALNLANTTLFKIHDAFLNLNGVKSDAEFWNKAGEQFKTFRTNVDEGIATLQKQTEPLQGQAAEAYKTFTDKVTEVTSELKAKNPELFSGDAKQLQAVGERALRTVVEEGQKLRDKLQKEGHTLQPQVEQTINAITDAAVQTAKDFRTQAEAAINTIQKKD